MDMEIERLKQDFNYCIGRLKKADAYFSTHTIKECERFLNAYNDLIRDISIIKNKLEFYLGRELSSKEKEYGF